MLKMHTSRIILITLSLFVLAIIYTGCKHDPENLGIPTPPDPPDPDPKECDTVNITYPGTVYPILEANCISCHSGQTPEGNLDFTKYDQLAFVAQNGALSGAINHEQGYSPMPQGADQLDSCSIAQIEIWIRDTTFTDPGGGGNDDPCDPDTVYFQNQIMPLINSSCATTDCHNKLTDEQEVLLVDYASVIEYGDIKPGDPWDSELFEKIMENDPEDRMPPPPSNPLTAEQKNLIKTWIEQGAKNNSCEEGCDTTDVTFSGSVWPTIETNCLGCHSGPQPTGDIPLTDYVSVVAAVNSGRLLGAISHSEGYSPMPKNAPMLIECKIDQFKIWIEDGTPNN